MAHHKCLGKWCVASASCAPWSSCSPMHGKTAFTMSVATERKAAEPMAKQPMAIMDGNEAAASVAYRASEVIAIYPITPSSTMGELSDEWAAKKQENLWGVVPQVIEMQSEGGAAGAVHGALQAGALATTFTASQGLLLMIPNMFKIAGELTSYAMHVSARTLATHALSIFGDHSDVMACRQTGFALLCSSSVQEAHDLACIAHAATLEARVPFLHFFDGFRTSHELAKVQVVSDDLLRSMFDAKRIEEHRRRALNPDHPVIRGTAQNPDTFFQAREACNRFYDASPGIVADTMKKFASLTGRPYRLFDYFGHPQAERVIVVMGSASQTVQETVDRLNDRGEKVGVVTVRLYRPFSVTDFVEAVPRSVQMIAVLDRTKEPGAIGEPLYQDVVTALMESRRQITVVIGGRYGLSSKEFTPAMVKAVFDELMAESPRRHFTVGINDDVTGLSLDVDDSFDIAPDDVFRAVFFGLGSDGTVGANKNSIKIIGEETENFAQGYFVYDSKKSGAMTISHLRFGPRPIRSPYLIRTANFVACHLFNFLEKYDVTGYAREGGVLLLNTPFAKEQAWEQLPAEAQRDIIEKKLKVYVIDAYQVARDTQMGNRINTVMQTCFFAISGVLPREEAIAHIKRSVEKTYGKKGEEVVRRNFAAIDHTLKHLYELEIPAVVSSRPAPPIVAQDAPDFVQRVTAMMLANKGDMLPVSAFPVDGTFATGTSRWEKRNLAAQIPVWEPELCIQCNKCAMACPHAAIRAKVYPEPSLVGAPETFKSMEYKAADFKGSAYTIQVAPEDCTGCDLCVMVCPAKDKSNPRRKAINMTPQAPLRIAERDNFKFFLDLPEVDRTKVRLDVKGSQFLQPLFEFSGACAGCGETPYIKLLTQLFGDRALIANATGCSSIFGGNLPTTPYCTNKDGRGPAWSNSLFEDNAEFGLGMRLAVESLSTRATSLLKQVSSRVGETLAKELIAAIQTDEVSIAQQRNRVIALREKLAADDSPEARALDVLADYLVRKSVWIVGGDGWAYDIGYGGLDHVLSLGRDVNMLVLDTEVYSNTGGQQSKSTPMGAAAKFASAGKARPKKDLALMAIACGNVYVATVAFGAKDTQTVKAFLEAESYPGPSLILAYSHCIAHGYDLMHGAEQQKLAVDSGYWPLFRYDPRRIGTAEPALQLDSNPPKTSLGEFTKNETRFRMVEQADAARYRELMGAAQEQLKHRYAFYQQLAHAGSGNGKPVAETRS
ncbi:pyruvate:ferredoxin (flavodoxin) oxidoreductase [soil metagenome]